MEKIGYRRAFDAKMRVKRNRITRNGFHKSGTNIHAAGERQFAINNQDFTVRAQIGIRQA
ncbi:hypothetical protein D9M70_526600 [compost metagenome]